MKLNIFFDESGKKGTPPMLMGAISIVDKIYTNDIFSEINNNLRENKIKYHFTKYDGNRGEKKNIIDLFTKLSPYLHTFRCNVIQYKKGDLPIELFSDMVYSKFPERVFYGLLRCKGNMMNIEASIYMEYATEYIKFPEIFKSQLNRQSLYRGEKFNINSCLLVPKNEQIGVELCDIILGIIRVILDFEKINPSMSKTYCSKVKLVNEILIISHVYEFFSNIKYFEWDNIQSLKEIKFRDYLDTYKAICSDI
ncbi:MAG: DUF3800 domain-containing protein [Clostridium sp.]|uniref:DUF3800 domain-containing protein n=1 Tax=Clostridium sp. TaxID=1506 RepID=UPI002A766A97|nr:DUF3800 domain-containing protein [Clostridium sp.]MDY2631654.1 DUF3800 domain-containing protein [Clostridium sp.]